MKKLIALLLLCSGLSYADTLRTERSSFTASNESAWIATSTYLMGVDVGAASSGGAIKIYNSTHTTGVLISSITLGTPGTHWFGDDGLAVKGVYYVTTGNTAGVTIIYKR